jgi:hypothetical protein
MGTSPARPPARPPALTRATSRSFQCADLVALADCLLQAGAEQLAPAEMEAARFRLEGGLLMTYATGRVVLGGPTPQRLGQLLDLWALEGGEA